jgi:hypothetical protein
MTTLPAAEKREAALMLASAFDDSPLFRLAFPEPASRGRILRTLFAIVLADAVRCGQVEVAYNHQIAGVLIWYPPGCYPMSATRILRYLPGYLRMVAMSPTGILRLFRAQATLNRVRPRQPHCHGYFLGGRPGGHVGSALLRCLFNKVDEKSWPIYLETQDPRAAKWYGRLGFTMLHDGCETVPGGPLTWTMWREPHAKNQRSPLADAKHVSQRVAAGIDRG